ncbi:MAG: glycosyltransferase [Lachnospiraceae bacterium]|jgi:teichuronic acid biosynthesis glycosyltransferase TuaG|nr:glycosyltransferase [Lachnospiraceae bacterium]
MVSIIIPVYNAEKYVKMAIASVLAQTFTDWELILSDDCSTDRSLNIIEELIEQIPVDTRKKIHVIRNDKNSGPAKTRNVGLAAARGRYLAYLDADDIWNQDKLAKQLAFMQEKEAAFSYTAYEFGDETGKGTGSVVKVLPLLTYRKALSRTIISTSTAMFDLERLDRDLLEMPCISSEDTATWWRILRHGYPAHGMNEVMTVYRRYHGSLSADKKEAIKRIWYLYRQREHLSLIHSIACFISWAVRATWRRL